MSAADLYSTALSALTDVRAQMLSPDWQAALDNEDPEDRLAASRVLLKVEQAILSLSNAALSDIASAMQANEADLTQATKNLENALADVTKITNVINTVTSVLNAVAKIVPLI